MMVFFRIFVCIYYTHCVYQFIEKYESCFFVSRLKTFPVILSNRWHLIDFWWQISPLFFEFSQFDRFRMTYLAVILCILSIWLMWRLMVWIPYSCHIFHLRYNLYLLCLFLNSFEFIWRFRYRNPRIWLALPVMILIICLPKSGIIALIQLRYAVDVFE